MANKSNILEKTTNAGITEFFRVNANNSYSDMVDVVGFTFPADSVKVYSFNLAAGTVKEKRVNLAYSKVDTVAFERQYVHYWYHLERAAVIAEYAKFCDAQQDSETLKTLREVINARYEHAMKALDKFANASSICETVKILVCADRKMKPEKYPLKVRNNFEPVEDVLRKHINKSDDAEKAVNLKPLREALKAFCRGLWEPTEDGTIKKYVYNPNARLTEEVYRVAMKGRERSKDTGMIHTLYMKPEELLREVVFACFEELQKKDEESAKKEENTQPENEATAK